MGIISENFQKIDGIYNKGHSHEILMKKKQNRIFHEFLGKFKAGSQA